MGSRCWCRDFSWGMITLHALAYIWGTLTRGSVVFGSLALNWHEILRFFRACKQTGLNHNHAYPRYYRYLINFFYKHSKQSRLFLCTSQRHATYDNFPHCHSLSLLSLYFSRALLLFFFLFSVTRNHDFVFLYVPSDLFHFLLIAYVPYSFLCILTPFSLFLPLLCPLSWCLVPRDRSGHVQPFQKWKN